MTEPFQPFSYINNENATRLAYLFILRKEEPWVIAMVAKSLSPDLASQMISVLPMELQSKVAREALTLRQATREQIIAIDNDIKENVEFVVGGMERVAAMLGEADAETRNNILNYLKAERPAVYDVVRQHFPPEGPSKSYGALDLACVIIPTFNEAPNIARLAEALRGLSPKLSIVVVDDGSPDGTGPAADEAAKKFAPMAVIHRSGKGGRGSACLAGFKKALSDPKVKYVVEMDADFSHDPKELPAMLELLETGKADVVVRSRYERASRIVDWSLARRVFSKLSNMFARSLLGIPISDYTNGYRAYTRKAAESIDFDRVAATGYIVLSEIAYQLHLKGLRFLCLPTVFVNRRRGQSNLSLKEIVGAFRGVTSLRSRYGRTPT
ncbi:MAG: glycosyltransferase [Elusimicrobia bacterium]|nr:glycosyltransferase [Elusimicrobiota bacterium]